jgi:hypothetical protein
MGRAHDQLGRERFKRRNTWKQSNGPGSVIGGCAARGLHRPGWSIGPPSCAATNSAEARAAAADWGSRCPRTSNGVTETTTRALTPTHLSRENRRRPHRIPDPPAASRGREEIRFRYAAVLHRCSVSAVTAAAARVSYRLQVRLDAESVHMEGFQDHNEPVEVLERGRETQPKSWACFPAVRCWNQRIRFVVKLNGRTRMAEQWWLRDVMVATLGCLDKHMQPSANLGGGLNHASAE